MKIHFTPTVRTPNFLMNALHRCDMLTCDYELMALHILNSKGETTSVSYHEHRSTFLTIGFFPLVALLFVTVKLMFRDLAEEIVSACEERVLRTVLALATTVIVFFVATAAVTFPILSIYYRELVGGWMLPNAVIGAVIAWFCVHAMVELGNALGNLSEKLFD